MNKTIIIRYSCPLCGIKNREVKVPERLAEESVEHWFHGVMITNLCADHHKHSPTCTPEKLMDIMIPVPEEGMPLGSGKQTRH